MTLNIDTSDAAVTLSGFVKWYDGAKGFGFVTVEDINADVLLSENVLHNFGQSSIVSDSFVEFTARATKRGMQVIDILSITGPAMDQSIIRIIGEPTAPLVAGRVKWFDQSKGFGFANEFGNTRDVFVHIEILRQCGLATLEASEAIAMRIQNGKDGLMASEVHAWNYAVNRV
ncbi:cold shock domain-containing protein [Amylibacter sp. SFDW26]|uniref:cold-shock protein n=1 Tax=Amylibacter sp. SFDW26 TaxID=2652722 RepID=UPI001261C0B0|nr:cold shock domain-containing protein [Amylibacter sp. SFDW26]KAB7610346.1 cold shock domain-containing protein [Amylibacter sp. SFDW26]